MTVRVNRVLVFAFVLAACSLCFVAGRYFINQNKIVPQSVLDAARDSIRTYKVVLDGALNEANELSQIVVTERQAKQLALIDKEKYRKLSIQKIDEVTELKGQIKVLLDSINNNANVIIINEPDSTETPCAKLPFSFAERNKYLNLYGEFNENAVLSLSMTVPIDLDITVAHKKGVPTAIVLSDNPYFRLNSIKSVKIVDDKRWYESKWLYGGVGVATGILIMSAK